MLENNTTDDDSFGNYDEDLDELARTAAAGDQDALDRLLALAQPKVARVAGRMLLYPQDAEEAAQDALLSISRHIEKFDGRAKFTTWMYSIAANSARSTYRSLKRRSREQATAEFPTDADPRTTSVIAGSRLDLLEALEVLAASSPDLAEALVLRDVNELDYAEIAALLDVSVGTVKSRIHRARQTVRPLLRIQ